MLPTGLLYMWTEKLPTLTKKKKALVSTANWERYKKYQFFIFDRIPCGRVRSEPDRGRMDNGAVGSKILRSGSLQKV